LTGFSQDFHRIFTGFSQDFHRIIYIYIMLFTPKAGGDPEGAGDAVPPNNKREGAVPGTARFPHTVGSHALEIL